MIRLVLELLLVACALPAMDTVVRLILAWCARRALPAPIDEPVRRCLVVVPSRGEQPEHVRKTLMSVRDADVLFVADGGGSDSEALARQFKAQVVVKEPAGPTKAAALAWVAMNHAATLKGYDAVLVLDVGSMASPTFFQSLGWRRGCDAMQAMLTGAGLGAGSAAAMSERDAQQNEDRGREVLGWGVRLRGTGMLFKPATFLGVFLPLRTRAEDLEASLMLISMRRRAGLMGPETFVADEKPDDIYSAAAQRARWLLGRYEILFRRFVLLMRAFSTRTVETTAFFVEIFGRPLSLTVPFRIVIGITFLFSGTFVALAAIVVLTAVIDAVRFVISTKSNAASMLRLVASWWMAIVLAPRALIRWTRARRP